MTAPDRETLAAWFADHLTYDRFENWSNEQFADALLAGPLAPRPVPEAPEVRTYTREELEYLLPRTEGVSWSRRLACPTCDAAPGEPCRAPGTGTRSSRSHNARKFAVEDLLLAEFRRPVPEGGGMPEEVRERARRAGSHAVKVLPASYSSTQSRAQEQVAMDAAAEVAYSAGRADERAAWATVRSTALSIGAEMVREKWGDDVPDWLADRMTRWAMRLRDICDGAGVTP